MSDTIISVEKLGKKYIIGHQQERHDTLRDLIANRTKIFLNPFKNKKSKIENNKEEFWALNDLSFEIKQGDRVGIIGRNGAGKSTLLKILSRITEPTTGSVKIKGRVASLLEVGTGFHPELTGRENIYLNGAILGMSKTEIRSKFDEIVAFAEVEKFLDTPVKHYSSGMYVRLAFAVAAHLEPEILIIDEVLAVGDAAFQKKCIGKMENFSEKDGKTVLFVSHNTTAIRKLCNKAILLKAGQLSCQGSSEYILHKYLFEELHSHKSHSASWQYKHHGNTITIDKIVLLVNGTISNSVRSGDQLTFQVFYKVIDKHKAYGQRLSISLLIWSGDTKLVNLWTDYCGVDGVNIASSEFVECTIERWPFRSHIMRLDVFSHIGSETQDWIEDCSIFDSIDGDYYKSGIITNPDQGMLFLEHNWKVYANK